MPLKSCFNGTLLYKVPFLDHANMHTGDGWCCSPGLDIVDIPWTSRPARDSAGGPRTPDGGPVAPSLVYSNNHTSMQYTWHVDANTE